MTVRGALADIGYFAWRPAYSAQTMAWGKAAALVLLVVFALDIGLDQLVSGLLAGWDAEAGFLPAAHDEDISLAEDLFLSLLFAPLTEEALFRGWMRGQIAALRFAAFGFAALALFSASLWAPPEWTLMMGGAGVVLVFAGLVQWSLTRHRDTAVPAWFTRHYGALVWGSTVLFGLIHLGNYEPLAHPLGVLVVLPQAIGGLLLAYTRTRLGLGAAIAHHAAYNAVWMAGDYGVW